MGAPIARGHGIGAIVIGVMEILFGLIIMICSFVVGGKIAGNSALSPYWAGIPVSITMHLLSEKNRLSIAEGFVTRFLYKQRSRLYI